MTTNPDPAAHQPCGCPEFVGLTRRGLLRGVALAGTSYAVGSAMVTLGAAPASAATGADGIVVVLSLRGAADGLSLVVPYGDPGYYTARPRLGVPAGQLLAPDGFFGLHPALAPLLPLWESGRLAAVHGTGLPAPNRSHFAAMEELEDADPGSSARVGWLNRLLGATAPADQPEDPLRGLVVGGGVVPASMYGPTQVMSIGDLDSATVAGDDQWDPEHRRVAGLHRLWDADSGPLAGAMRSALSTAARLDPARAQPDDSASYPSGDLGRALAGVARTLKADVGVRVVTVDQGDWDMHTQLGTLDWGRMRENAGTLAAAVAAFFDDLGDTASRVTLVTITEFGRRVAENANWGLDHGWGGVMLLAGAGVKGGRVHGTWTPLETGLDADLPVTTDYRSVLAEVVATRTGASTAQVFPGFTPESVGVMTSL